MELIISQINNQLVSKLLPNCFEYYLSPINISFWCFPTLEAYRTLQPFAFALLYAPRNQLFRFFIVNDNQKELFAEWAKDDLEKAITTISDYFFREDLDKSY